MRICILTVKNHIYANLLIKKILGRFSDDVFVIIESTVLLSGRGRFGALWKYFKISGARYVGSQVLKSTLSRLISFFLRLLRAKNHRFYSYKFLRLPNLKKFVASANINSPQFLEWLAHEVRPDLILSVYCNQILKERLIRETALGAYNIHPSLLPAYRGVSPTFWALARGEARTGITLHKIAAKIDGGAMVAQREMDILRGDSEHSLYVRCTEAGFDLIADLIEQLKLNVVPASIQKKTSSESYFSLPTKEAVKEFLKHGRKFWTFKELISGK